MKDVKLTRDLFLWCMSGIYFFAFASLYYQIPGLYGDNGILPVKHVLKNPNRSPEVLLQERLTLLWFSSYLGLDAQWMMDLLAFAGTILSFLSLLFARLRSMTVFAFLWALYMSLYQVGQTFLWFQWDILLLEAGFLTIILAPVNILFWKPIHHNQHDSINLWLVKWLLFRLMFASGVVKLTSQCPTWWGLTALTFHFESQCIATPLAWYVHQLPQWVLRLGVVFTYVIEIAIPFLFFWPVRSVRIFSFYVQVLFQIFIIITGNYNFFNILTIALCVSLLDDDFIRSWSMRKAPPPQPQGKKSKESANKTSLLQTVGNSLSRFSSFVIYSALLYFTVAFFSIKFKPDFTVESEIAFTSQGFHKALEKVLEVSIYVGAASFVWTFLIGIYRSLFEMKGFFKKLLSFLQCLFFGAVAFWIFSISIVPHSVVDPDVHQKIWPVVKRWHDKTNTYQLVNSYGLFRRMTGVGGRPEIIIEGSNSMQDGWKEYHFNYKPGSLSDLPAIVAPHQPRLDWQMWFAALSTYQQSPWFVSLINRLLNGQKEVLELLNQGRNPFPKVPPKYIRATKYTYQFTNWKDTKTPQNWWTRKKAGEYLPVLSKDHASLTEYLKNHGIHDEKITKSKVKNQTLQNGLAVIRQYVKRVDAHMLIWSVFLSVLVTKLILPGDRHKPSGK